MRIREMLGLPVNTNLKAHRTYRIWSGMRYRVSRDWHHAKKHYARLGVTVCDRWLGADGFINFLADMGHPPTHKHTLERIDNTGPYTKENCIWALPAQQNRNKSSCRYFETPVGRMCLTEAARYYGVAPHLVFGRLYRGITDQTQLFAPSARKRKESKNA